MAVTQAQVQAASERFPRRRGLPSREQTNAWMRSQQLTVDDLATLMSLEVALDCVLRAASGSTPALLPLELQRRAGFAMSWTRSLGSSGPSTT
jgi:hypothetical protein